MTERSKTYKAVVSAFGGDGLLADASSQKGQEPSPLQWSPLFGGVPLWGRASGNFYFPGVYVFELHSSFTVR